MIKFLKENKCVGYILPYALQLIPKRPYKYVISILEGESFIPNKIELLDSEGKIIPTNQITFKVVGKDVILSIGNLPYNRFKPCKMVIYSLNQGKRYSEPFYITDLYEKELKLLSWKCRINDTLQCISVPIRLIQTQASVNSEFYQEVSTGNVINVVKSKKTIASFNTSLMSIELLTRLIFALNSRYAYINEYTFQLDEQPENYTVQGSENCGYISFNCVFMKNVEELDFDTYIITQDEEDYVTSQEDEFIITQK